MAEKDKIVEKNNITNSFVNEKGEHLKFTKNSMSIYSNDPRKPHSSTHINVNAEKGTFTVNTKDSDGKKTSNAGQCFLTTACMQHYSDAFDDNCRELNILRWFRDNFVATEDIIHYYEIAPMIVKSINESPDSVEIYRSIYERIISVCVNAISCGKYEFAYNTYRNAIIDLENEFVKPALQARLIRCLSNI